MNINLILSLFILLVTKSTYAKKPNKSEKWVDVTVYYKDKSLVEAKLKMKNFYTSKVPLNISGSSSMIAVEDIDSIKGAGFRWHTVQAYRPLKSGKEKNMGTVLMPVLYQEGSLIIYHTLEKGYAQQSLSPRVSHNFFLSSSSDNKVSFMVMTLSSDTQMPISGTEQNFRNIVHRYVDSEFGQQCPDLGTRYAAFIKENKGQDLIYGLVKIYQSTCK